MWGSLRSPNKLLSNYTYMYADCGFVDQHITWLLIIACVSTTYMYKDQLRCVTLCHGQQFNVRHSLIDAFASFFLLSFFNFAVTSYSLVNYIELYTYTHSSRISYVIYWDGSVTQYVDNGIFVLACVCVCVVSVLLAGTGRSTSLL